MGDCRLSSSQCGTRGSNQEGGWKASSVRSILRAKTGAQNRGGLTHSPRQGREGCSPRALTCVSCGPQSCQKFPSDPVAITKSSWGPAVQLRVQGGFLQGALLACRRLLAGRQRAACALGGRSLPPWPGVTSRTLPLGVRGSVLGLQETQLHP